MKDFLKNPMISKLFLLNLRIDFQNAEYAQLKQQLDLKLDESFNPNYEYYNYKNDKILFSNLFLIIYKTDYFSIICLYRPKLEDVFNKIKSLKGITCSEIEEVTDTTILKMVYPFILSEYVSSKLKEDFSKSIYDKIIIALNFFKEGLRGNELYFYISYYTLSALVEELLAKIAIKESIHLRSGFSIGSHIFILKGKKFLLTKHDSDCKEEEGKRKIEIFYEQTNSRNIFIDNKDKEEGKRIISLLEELNEIRTKYVHFTMQEPNNPSDVVVGIINFGQFLIWGENNGYL